MNPFLEKMGYGREDRVLITHIDDMGFCHAANIASLECLQSGSATCASIIVNAPWFREAVRICLEYESLDIGVHLTLTSEYPVFRWPALSSRDPSTGLLDREGCLWHTMEDAVANIDVDAAAGEMRAQIDLALGAGLSITHIDTHMGTVIHPKFMRGYVSLAEEYGVVPFLPHLSTELLAAMNMLDLEEQYLEIYADIDNARLPILDYIMIDTLKPLADKKDFYYDLIDKVQPGLTHLLFHPAKDGEELAAIADTHASRHADYLMFSNPDTRQYILDQGIHLIGYKELQESLK